MGRRAKCPKTMAEPAQVVRDWLDGEVSVSLLGQGHINDTWRVQGAGATFVLQRVSRAVFPRPDAVMENVALVVEHLSRQGRTRVPALIPTLEGAAFTHDPDGGIWRLWEYVGGTRTLASLSNAEQARAAGDAFGRFQRDVAALAGRLHQPIPGFLRLGHYLALLDDAVEAGPPGAEAEALLQRIGARRDLAGHFDGADRPIHGDCKVDNLLFHAGRDDVAAVLDLDTVMMGHWAWDFGDLVRSAAADSAAVNVERFAAIARGYLGSGALARDAVTAADLVLAPRHVALMLGVRFLTDHLRGDRYFKVAARGDNLVRATRQLDLLEDMERRESAMLAATGSG